VWPSGQTYAADSDYAVNITGPDLQPLVDSAELHRASFPGCTDPARVALSYSVVEGVWIGHVPAAAGTVALCYQTNASALERVVLDGAAETLQVQARFYVPAAELFYSGRRRLDVVPMTLSGYGLVTTPGSLWFQPDGTLCARDSPRAVAVPSSTVSSVVVRLTLELTRGLYRVCHRTPRGRTLTSVDIVSMQPTPPSRISPASGPVDANTTVTLLDGGQIDLANAIGAGSRSDVVVLCAPDAAALNAVAVDATSFALLPPGNVPQQLALCFESGVPVFNQNGTRSYPRFTLQPNFAAVPSLRGAAVVPAVAVVGSTHVLSAAGSMGLDVANDRIVVCAIDGAEVDPPVALSALRLASTPALRFNWTATFAAAAAYRLCYNSTGNPGLAPRTPFASVTAEPELQRLAPSAINAAATVTVLLGGVSTRRVTRLIVDVLQRPCSALNLSDTANLLVFDAVNSSAVLSIPLRGTVRVCYTGISGRVLEVVEPIVVSPRVFSMEVSDVSDVIAGCRTPVLVNGSGVDLTRDLLYASAGNDCSADSAPVTPGPGGISGVFSLATLYLAAPAPGEYSLCFRPAGASAGVKRGTFAAQDPFSLTRLGSEYLLTFRCVYGNFASYSFGTATGPGNGAIPLDDPLSNNSIRVRHMPFRYARAEVDVSAPANVSASANMVLSPSPTSGYCAAVPVDFSSPASAKKRFAERYFVIHNYVALSCQPQTGAPASRPQVAFDEITAEIANDTSILGHAPSVMTTLTAALPSLTDPVAGGVKLLDSTTATLQPGQPATTATVEAHFAATNALLSLQNTHGLTSNSEASTVQLKAIARIHRAASALCASGQPRTADMGAFVSASLTSVPNSDRVVADLGAPGRITVTMAAPSTAGYCLSTAMLRTTSALGSPGVANLAAFASVQRKLLQNTAPTVANIDGQTVEFNLPVFAVAANPESTVGLTPDIALVTIRYAMPDSLVPDYDYDATVLLFVYTDGAWVHAQGVNLNIERGTNTAVISLPSSRKSSLIVSGRMVFLPRQAADDDTLPEIDWVMLITTLVLFFAAVVVAIVARMRDAKLDASKEPDVMAIDDHSFSFLELHRYAACFHRAPHHPASTVARVLTLFTYIFAAHLFAVLYTASDDAPYRQWVGVLGGAIVTALATPFASFVRTVLLLQLKDRPGIIASLLSAVSGTAVFVGAGAIPGAIVAASVGGAALLFTGVAFRKTWTLRTQRKPGPLPDVVGRGTFAAVAAASIAFGIVFSTSQVSPAHVRREQRFLAVFLVAVGLDAVILEPVKCFVLGMAQRRAATAAEEEAARRVEAVRRAAKEQAIRLATPGRHRAERAARGRMLGAYDDDGAATAVSLDPDEFMTAVNPASTAWESVADDDDLEDATSAEGFDDADDFRTVVVSNAGDGLSTAAQTVDVDHDLFDSGTEAENATEASDVSGFTSNADGFATDDDDDGAESGFQEVDVFTSDGFESDAPSEDMATAVSGTVSSGSNPHPYPLGNGRGRHFDPYE